MVRTQIQPTVDQPRQTEPIAVEHQASMATEGN